MPWGVGQDKGVTYYVREKLLDTNNSSVCMLGIHHHMHVGYMGDNMTGRGFRIPMTIIGVLSVWMFVCGLGVLLLGWFG